MNQKVLSPVFIILLIVSSIGGYVFYQNQYKPVTQQTISTETENWKIYTNKNIAFSIQYPLEWKVLIETPTRVVFGYEDAGPSFFAEVYQNPNKLGLKEWFLDSKSKLGQSGIDFTFTNIKVNSNEGLTASGAVGPYVILKVPNQESILIMGGESFEFNQILSTFKFTN